MIDGLPLYENDFNKHNTKNMQYKKLLSFIMVLMLAINVSAESFTYFNRGIAFKCKVKDGKAIITGFDKNAAVVVIPAQVKNKKGHTLQVSTVDLYGGYIKGYKTRTVVIEQGITEISKLCFLRFLELSEIYIPNSIEKVGKYALAFRKKNTIKFNMPSTIRESDLLAGNVIYTKAVVPTYSDPIAGIDLSDYSDDSAAGEDEVSSVKPSAPKIASITPGTSDIDMNIPRGSTSRENTFCLIVANEKYANQDTPNVKYAAQDGKTFEEYCLRTLGLPRENIRFAVNAKYLEMKEMLKWFGEVADAYGKDANFIVYYAGHGVPDEKGNCTLIPADVSINDVNNGYSLKEIYTSLGKLPLNSALVLIDACFSGNDRQNVAALDEAHRGIAPVVKQEAVTGNVVVLTAASGTETALAYEEQAHGLFSYFIMKKLQDTKGEVSYGELYDYVKKNVMRKSIVAKGKKQTPCVTVSPKMLNSWKNIKF